MRFVVHLGRIILGAIFLVFGLNKLLPLFATPPVGGTAAEFMGGLAAAEYFFPFMAIVEIAGGLLLLLGRFVPLALALLAPIVLHVMAFHLFLAPAGLPLAILLVLLSASLAWFYRDSYRDMVRMYAEPRFRKGTIDRAARPPRRGQRREPAEA